MGKAKVNKTKDKSAGASTSGKVISKGDVKHSSFEIFLEDGGTFQNDLDDWFRSEKELTGYDL